MGLSHRRLNAATVYADLTRLMIDRLGIQAYKQSLGVSQIADILTAIVSMGQTLNCVIGRFTCCLQTAWNALYAFLPEQPDELEVRLQDGLWRITRDSNLRKRTPRRGWSIAIDLNDNCYYGDPQATRGVVGGQHKQGTHYFHRYATAMILHPEMPFTVALTVVCGKFQMHEIVSRLLDRCQQEGLKIQGVVMDAGFGSGEVILELQRRKLAYVIPLQRTGAARRKLFERPSGTITTIEWKTKQSKNVVTTQVLVQYEKKKGGRMVYAFAGYGVQFIQEWKRRRTAIRRMYASRFGIETSYRQKNQARGWTTSRSLVYRLLLEGLSYWVRQLWVLYRMQIRAVHGRAGDEWLACCTLEHLLRWLLNHVDQLAPALQEIPLEKQGE